MTRAAAQAGGPRDVLAALRPSQWTKNTVVLAAFLFAYWDETRAAALGAGDLAAAGLAALLFCALSSGVYLVNDLRDIEADRAHPLKRCRPIAAGRVSPRRAGVLAAILLAVSLAGAWLLSAPFAAVAAGYVAIQAAYSLRLKHLAFADILVIAAGFVLRALAGAVVLEVAISPWLLLCTFLLALFLALCKRRHEKVELAELNGTQRPSLGQYDERLLDQLVAIVASATIVSYAIYTLWPETVAKFGTHGLGFTIPFVIFGIFRYLDLVYRHRQGDRPDKILLSDRPILLNLLLYGLALIVIFLSRG